MLGIIFMVAISVIVIVATFACIVFCKCKKKLKQAKTVGIEPTATDDDTGKVPVADTGSVAVSNNYMYTSTKYYTLYYIRKLIFNS